MNLTDYYHVVPYCEDLKHSLQCIPCKIFKYENIVLNIRRTPRDKSSNFTKSSISNREITSHLITRNNKLDLSVNKKGPKIPNHGKIHKYTI